VRHEWLGTNIFQTIEEVQDTATKWLWSERICAIGSRKCANNNDRPNMAIGGITPAMKLNQYQAQQIAA
jgi:putative transposase